MEEQLISFNTAKLAKEKGFDIPCENFYVEYIDDDDVDLFNYEEQRGSRYAELYRNNTEFKFSAPTQSLLQKWIREIHNIIVEPIFDETADDGFPWLLSIYKNKKDIVTENHKLFGDYFDNYEETLEVGLYQALKLTKI